MVDKFKITVLGTGTSVGIPALGKLGWGKCNPNNSKNKSLYNPKTTKHLIYCNRNRNWLPITLISSLYLLKSNKG